jgi:putative ABC transport system substrate-binding protein
MRRREFITLLGGAAAWPLAARAQQASKMPRVGFLFYGAPELALEIDAFRKGLRELGYSEGQNIIVEYRFARGQVGKLPELAAELVGLNVEVIVTPTTPASMAAKQATSTIPIVIAGVADPVGAGLITNFRRPGGNITGLSSSSAELGGKRLELLKGVVPNASRVAVLHNPADASNVLVLKELQAAAPALHLTLQSIEVRKPDEFAGAFAAMARDRADAFFGAAGILTFEHRDSIVDLAAQNRLVLGTFPSPSSSSKQSCLAKPRSRKRSSGRPRTLQRASTSWARTMCSATSPNAVSRPWPVRAA